MMILLKMSKVGNEKVIFFCQDPSPVFREHWLKEINVYGNKGPVLVTVHPEDVSLSRQVS